MLKSLPLLRGSINLQAALEHDDNILQELAYPEQRIDFFTHLHIHLPEIKAIVSHHLGLKPELCRVGEVSDSSQNRVLIRFPLPYKIGETRFPGNADEKLRCEAATLYGFKRTAPLISRFHIYGGSGFPMVLASPKVAPLFDRLMLHLRRTANWLLRRPIPCRYISSRVGNTLGVGYLITEFIEKADGRMLSETWETFRDDSVRRSNLFNDLSRIMLAMAKCHASVIGSLAMDDTGVLSLTNRPLTLQLHQLENEGVATGIDRKLTYQSSETYALDLLSSHDARLRCVQNAIRDEYDGKAQLAALTSMRAIYRHFLDHDLRHGPFVFTFTDLHQSNIFVDENWHITFLIDLEWTGSFPIEMLHPPFWFTGQGIDLMGPGEHLSAYSVLHSEFLEQFEEAEKSCAPIVPGKPLYCTNAMKRGWKNKGFWYFHALHSPKGLYNIFLQHIQPIFEPSHGGDSIFDQVFAPYWAPNSDKFIATKVEETNVYNQQLRETFNIS
ncbi:hypothetical protein LOZ66_004834 [Ophidiomyces ophidiicola]|nr:hypothetical protein LOZ66_004834 [Ophidiomyces ophidiicola]